MSKELRQKILEAASDVLERIEPHIKSSHGYNYSIEYAKRSCLMYCNLKQYAEPHNKAFWGEVAEYINKRF